MVKGGGPESFLRYRAFYEVKKVGHAPGEPLFGAIGCVLSSGTKVNRFKGGDLYCF